MTILTLIWLIFPLFLGLIIYLLPRLDRYLAFSVAIVSFIYGLSLFTLDSPLSLTLLDSFGISLLIDSLSGYFILTNALVTLAVLIYCQSKNKTAFFYGTVAILHGSVNAAFICADFVSIYVALEVIGIAAFLLIVYPRSDRSIWVGLRYLFISNTAMLFYMVGAILVYQTHHSFSFEGLRGSPPEAIALIFLGLLSKGGVFISGWWLPLTHSEAESPVSALLSGVVVKAGVFPLLRCALMMEEIDPLVRLFGVGTAFLGVFYAIWERDTKRILAMSTISQLGWLLVAPQVSGFYALCHGLAKSGLFLTAGSLPSRDIEVLQRQPMPFSFWWLLTLPSLSISGFPLLAGFEAKITTLNLVLPWQIILMNVAAVGTVIVYAKLIFLPWGEKGKVPEGVIGAGSFLIAVLIIANFYNLKLYTLSYILKALLIIAIGWAIYGFLFRRWDLHLPRHLEKFDHLIGVMSLVLVLLFWMVLPWSSIS